MDKNIASKLANLIGNISIGYKGSSPDYTPAGTKAALKEFLESLELPVSSDKVESSSGMSEQEIVSLIGKNLRIQEERFTKFVKNALDENSSACNKMVEGLTSKIDNIELDKDTLQKMIDEAVAKALVKPEITVEVYRAVEYDEKDKNKIVKTYSRAKIPEIKHVGDSGADGYVCFDDATNPDSYVGVGPGQVAQVPLGISCKIPEGYEIQLRPRSGESKFGHVAIFGTIDSKYRGVFKANVANISTEPLMIQEGDRLCQLVLKPIENVNYTLVEGIIDKNTERGTDGFGSTGKK